MQLAILAHYLLFRDLQSYFALVAMYQLYQLVSRGRRPSRPAVAPERSRQVRADVQDPGNSNERLFQQVEQLCVQVEQTNPIIEEIKAQIGQIKELVGQREQPT
jgi:hypothetical protein